LFGIYFIVVIHFKAEFLIDTLILFETPFIEMKAVCPKSVLVGSEQAPEATVKALRSIKRTVNLIDENI